MKRFFLLLFGFVFFLLAPLQCIADTLEIQEQFESSGAAEVLNTAESEVFPSFDSKKIAADLSNGNGFDAGSIVKKILSFFMGDLKQNLRMCAMITAAGFILGLFCTMQSAYGGKGVSECGFIVGYCVFAGLLSAAFSSVISPAERMIENVSLMINGTIPILLTLLTYGGSLVSASLFAPVLITLANVLSSVIKGVILPLILCSFALSVAANMSDRISLSNTVLTVRKSVKWILLFLMAVFAGIFGVYGLSGSAIDASAGKAARFAIGSGIPLVGGVAADSLETVVAMLGATRSIIGTAGMCAVVAAALSPIIKTAVLMWSFRLCCAVIEPFSDKRAVTLLNDAAECISLIFSTLISVCLIFIGALGVLLLVGNYTAG